MPAHAALQYARESFDTRAGEMMGRRVAGETLLKAWIRYADADPLTAWVHRRADGAAFEAQVRELGSSAAVLLGGAHNLAPLLDAQALWLADPAISRHAWERRWFKQNAWSIVGITHTISTASAMDLIANLAIAPVQPWDALICTSRAVRKTVETLLEHQAAYLAERLGATHCTGPELPIIPLGVACDDFAQDDRLRAKWRNRLGIAEEDVAILQFGRLSLHLKAHPQPLYLALKKAAERGGPRLHLILAGQPTNPQQGVTFRQLAEAFADCVTTHFVDGASADAGEVRSAADIFSLLSDNIQESFGLAPVEGMAAGLPVVGSDWDGLRDTIEHGVTGYLIDTVTPGSGAGELIARDHALGLDDYHHYIARVAQVTAVDLGQAADAFATLAADRSLRAQMGEAGRRRARDLFDWPHIIRAYLELLHELANIRASAAERATRRSGGTAQPARMDPFTLFAAYPTESLGASTRLELADGAFRISDLPGGADTAMLVGSALPDMSVLDEIGAELANGGKPMLELVDRFAHHNRRKVVGAIGWLLKFGAIRRAS